MHKDNISRAIKYIEEHSMDTIIIEQLAKISGYSSDHFAHFFSKSTGIPVATYIRRQRLALAALDLLNGAACSEIALKYGFETASGFSKTFKKYYNISPSEYKARWKNYLRPSFEELPELTCVVYLLEPPSKDFPLSEAGAYWYGKDFSFSNISPEDWAKLLDSNVGKIGAWMPAAPEKGGKVYAFGPIVSRTDYVPEYMHIVSLPAARYAVFQVPRTCLNSEMHRHIVSLWNRLYELWFANGKFHYDEGKIAFELYKGFETYIYVPISDEIDAAIFQRDNICAETVL